MKPFSMNLSKMKKISGDKNSSTFLHPSGHKMVISHKAVSPALRMQLQKMPAQNLADGGAVSEDEASADRSPASSDYSLAKGAPPDDVPPQPESNGLVNFVSKDLASVNPEYGPPESLAAPTQQPTDSIASSQSSPSADQPIPTQQSSQSSGVSGISPLSAYQTGLAGINAQQQAESTLGKQQSQAYQNYMDQAKQHEFDWKNESNSKLHDIDATIQDIQDSHINPSHYLENMSVPQKIGTAIGLILGGAGAGAGRPNPGVEFLNSQINRDIESQKQNINNKSTLLGAFQNQYQNSVAAENMYRATRLGELSAQLQKAAATSSDPMAQARALQAKAQLQSQIVPLVNAANLAQLGQKFNGSVPGGSAGGSENEYKQYLTASQRLNPDLYKDAEAKYLPGEGMASIPLTPEDRKVRTSYNSIGPLIDKAIGLQKQFGETGAWSPDSKAQANAVKNELTVQLNELSGLNRLNHEEYQNYGQQVGNIGGVNLGGTLEGLKQMKDALNTKRNVQSSQIGLVPFAGAHSPSGFNPQQEQNIRLYMRNNPGMPQQQAMSRLKQAGYL